MNQAKVDNADTAENNSNANNVIKQDSVNASNN